MAQITARRIVGTIVFGFIAIYSGSRADYVGAAVAVLSFLAGAASVGLGPAWLGSPGRPTPRYGWAAAGSALGLIVAGAAAALNVPNAMFIFAAAVSGFIGGFVLGLVLIRYPDAPR